MNEKTRNVLENVLGISFIVAGSFATYCFTVKKMGYSPAKSQEFYDAEALERLKNLYLD